MEKTLISVGVVAKRCGVKVSTLHFYEQKGLITSYRTTGNQRQYKAEVIRRISVIKAAQKMGISLEDIKKAFAILPKNRTPTKSDWQALSKSWQTQLNQKISALQQLRDKIDGCIGCGCLSLKSCPIYNQDDNLASLGPGPVILEQRHKKLQA
jgi:MerR family redox-sensitive transcriptional activator SoxR